ncbi:MAG: prolipoprotein diacylglyceryl transferase [Pseudoruegeria sp.]
MQAVLSFPDIGPEIFALELGGFTLALRWYALAYIVGLIAGWQLITAAVKRPGLWAGNTAPMKPEQVEELLTWVILGVVLGGRFGFTMFYEPAYYLANPIDILKIWQGGMSFHGGFLGVVVAAILFSKRQSIPLSALSDSLAIAAPLGLLLGRLANFINAELWGRPSDVPWAVIFPGAAAQDCPGIDGLCARHPSQLYEAGLEGLLLGLLLLALAFGGGWLKRPWALTGVFLMGYGASRIFVELFRQADAQFITATNPMGYVVQLGSFGLSMGQTLSIPMLIIGAWLVYRSKTTA